MLLNVLRLAPILMTLFLPSDACAQYRIPDDMVISMQRGNCEGGCPVYRILIFANGDVIWQGRARVGKIGLVLSQIERDQIRVLIQDFQSIDFFNLENIYGFRENGCRSTAPDMPMAIILLAIGGVSKTLLHHDGCVGEVSQKLTDLERRIDEAAGAARWIKAPPSAKKPQ